MKKSRDNTNYFVILILIICYIPFLQINPSESYNSFIFIYRGIIAFIGITFIFFLKQDDYRILFLIFILALSYLMPLVIGKDESFKNYLIVLYPIGVYSMIAYFSRVYTNYFIIALKKISICIIVLYYILLIYNLFTRNPINSILVDNSNGVKLYMIFVIGSILLYIEKEQEGKFLKLDYFFLFSAILGIVLSHSVTGIISCLAGLVVFIFHKNINSKYIYGLYGILFFLFVIIRDKVLFELAPFFKYVLGKDITFTHRTWRWDAALEIIHQNPLFGKLDIYNEVYHFAQYKIDFYNPHNGILQIGVFAGCVGIIVFLLILRRFSLNLKELPDKTMRIFLVILTMTMINGLMESCFSLDNFSFYTFIIIENVLAYKNKCKIEEVRNEKVTTDFRTNFLRN